MCICLPKSSAQSRKPHATPIRTLRTRCAGCVNLFAQHIGERIIARQQRRVPGGLPVTRHRTADAAALLLDHGRKVTHHRRNAAIAGHHVRRAFGALAKPRVVNHLIDRRRVVHVVGRRGHSGQVLAGVRMSGGRAALVVLHFAGARIEAGNVGEFGIPLLLGGAEYAFTLDIVYLYR